MSLSHPKPGTGIKQSLVQNYAFEDQAWADPTSHDHAKFMHLARRCVLVGEGFYILDKHTNTWVPVSRKGALSKLLSERTPRRTACRGILQGVLTMWATLT